MTERQEKPGRLPLEGVRVLDFCVVWAGTFTTLLLGDLGAEVIKVENPHILQPMTRGAARPQRELLSALRPTAGGYPNGDPGLRPWNYSPTFVQLYRNKKSFTVDLRLPEGLDVLRRLVAKSDIVVENNAPDTLAELGITWEWLRGINPSLIYLRMPAYGLSGQYSHARALGVHLESVMGHTLLRGYRDRGPDENSAIFSGDYMAGTQGALAAMLALWQRRKTGKGQLVELPQAENAAGLLAQAFMDYLLNRQVQKASGNRSIAGEAPCGVYPCRPVGPAAEAGERWIAIAITSDKEWLVLRQAMGEPEWANEPALAGATGRLEAHDLLDERLAEWTQGFDDDDLFHRLQALGVPAAPVLDASRVIDDPHVAARGVYSPSLPVMDDIGEWRWLQPFYHFPVTPALLSQTPVALGEHNDYVYRDVIGVRDEEYEALKLAGHITVDLTAGARPAP